MLLKDNSRPYAKKQTCLQSYISVAKRQHTCPQQTALRFTFLKMICKYESDMKHIRGKTREQMSTLNASTQRAVKTPHILPTIATRIKTFVLPILIQNLT